MLLDQEVRRGATETFRVTISVDDVIQDITNWTVFFTVKDRSSILKQDDNDTTTALIELTNGLGDHSAPLAGETEFEVTADLKPGNYIYDIKWIDDNNKVGSLPPAAFCVGARVTERIA